MANKPPIIISNGGMASELTKGLVAEEAGKRPDQIIMENVRNLNLRVTGANPDNEPLPVAVSLAEESGQARILWRLSTEKGIASETGAGAR